MSVILDHNLVEITSPQQLTKKSLGRTVGEICSQKVNASYAKAALKEKGVKAYKLVHPKTKKVSALIVYSHGFDAKRFGATVVTETERLATADAKDIVEIVVLCVDPSMRRRNFAKLLLDHVLSQVSETFVVLNQVGDFPAGQKHSDPAAILYHKAFRNSFVTVTSDDETATFYVDKRVDVLNAIRGTPGKGPTARKAPPAKAAAGAGNKRKATSSSSKCKFAGGIYNTFQTYSHRLLKTVSRDATITSRAMCSLESLLQDLFGKIADRAADLAKSQGRVTMDERDVQAATRLVLSGELQRFAVSRGTKAITLFESSDAGTRGNRKLRSERAGLLFPVGRVESMLKDGPFTKRVSGMAAVYLAAVLEYVAYELLLSTFEATKASKRSRISQRDLMLAVNGDAEMSQVFSGVFAHAGVQPHIEAALLPAKKQKKQ